MRCIRRSLAHLLPQVARGYARPRGAALCLIYACLIIAITGCTSEDRIDAPKVASLSVPPDHAAPVVAVAPIPTPMDTFRALAPPEGAKFTPLFAEPLKDEDARFKRLEDQVQSLRNDFDTVVPSLVRLVAVEKDMKNLVAQLQTLTDANAPPAPAAPLPPAAAPVAPAPAAKEQPKAPVKEQAKEQPKPAPKAKEAAKPKTAAPAPAPAPAQPKAPATNAAPPAKSGATEIPAGDAKASSTGSPEAAPKGNQSPEGAASLPLQPLPMKNEKVETPEPAVAAVPVVKALRVGDHEGTSRIVLELTAKPAYKALLVNDNKQLIIDLPGSSWSAKPAGILPGSALAGAYKYEEGKVTINLSAPAVIKTQTVHKSVGKDVYVLVIDLAKAPQVPEKPQ